jgi:hypothetical protein
LQFKVSCRKVGKTDVMFEKAGAISMTIRGGARPGAGRKPKQTVILRRTMAAEILSAVDEVQVWRELIERADYRTRLDAMKYLTDRRDGKAPQAVISVEAQTVPETIECAPVPYRQLAG